MPKMLAAALIVGYIALGTAYVLSGRHFIFALPFMAASLAILIGGAALLGAKIALYMLRRDSDRAATSRSERKK